MNTILRISCHWYMLKHQIYLFLSNHLVIFIVYLHDSKSVPSSFPFPSKKPFGSQTLPSSHGVKHQTQSWYLNHWRSSLDWRHSVLSLISGQDTFFCFVLHSEIGNCGKNAIKDITAFTKWNYGGFGPSHRLCPYWWRGAKFKILHKAFTNNEGSSLFNDGYVNKTSLFSIH